MYAELSNCILRDYKNNYKLLNYVDTLTELIKLLNWNVKNGNNKKLNTISIDIPSIYRTRRLYKDNMKGYKLYNDNDYYATLRFKSNSGLLCDAFTPKRLSESQQTYYKILTSKNKDKYIYIDEPFPLSNFIFGFTMNVDVDESLLKNNKDLIMIDDSLYEKIEKTLFEENPFDQPDNVTTNLIYNFKFINLDEQNLYPTIDDDLFKLCDSKTNDTVFRTRFLYPLKKEEVILNKNIITLDSYDVTHNEILIMYSANDDMVSSLELVLTI